MKLLDSFNDLNYTFDSSIFENGGIDDSGNNSPSSYYLYRLRTKGILYCNDNIKIMIPFGFYIGIHTFNVDGSHIAWSGWIAQDKRINNFYEIPKNTYFRILIQREIQDTSEVLSVSDTINQFMLFSEKTFNDMYYKNLLCNSIPEIAFINGDMSNGRYTPNRDYRIVSKFIWQYPISVTIKIPSNYFLGLHYFNDDNTFDSWSGWKSGEITIEANQKFKIIIRKDSEDTSKTLDIETVIPLFYVYNEKSSILYNNSSSEETSILKAYGSMRIVPVLNEKIYFLNNNDYSITVKLPSNLFIFSQSGNDTFERIVQETTTIIVNNNYLLVLNLTTKQIESIQQSAFNSNRTNYILLLWNHYGNIKGQFREEYIDSLLYINNNNETFEITCRQGQVDNYPENTLQGFSRSKDFGYNHVRVSFGWTSDGIAICSHFEEVYQSTLRNLDGSQITDQSIKLSDLTYQYIAEHYDAGIYKGSEFAGITVPTLEEVLKQCKKLSQKVDIEYKFGYTAERLENLLQLIYTIGLEDYILLSTASTTQINQVKNSDYKIQTGLIAHLTSENVTNTIALNPDRMDIFDSDTYNSSLVLEIHKHNIKIKVGSSYNFTTASDFIEKYDVIECANQINPIYIINRE